MLHRCAKAAINSPNAIVQIQLLDGVDVRMHPAAWPQHGHSSMMENLHSFVDQQLAAPVNLIAISSDDAQLEQARPASSASRHRRRFDGEFSAQVGSGSVAALAKSIVEGAVAAHERLVDFERAWPGVAAEFGVDMDD